MILRIARPGTTVVVITARDPAPFVAHLRRLERAGYPVVVVACGIDGPADAGRARAAGLTARSARLDGPWRTAGQLVVGG
jgi:ABC-type sugar transport system substrate-binding protein